MTIIFESILILLIGVATGFVGAIAGGGGLISIPALVLFGLPPQVAIATNKLGSVGLHAGATTKFWKERRILWKYVPLLSALAIAGALIGSHLLIEIDEGILSIVVAVLLLALLPVMLIKRDIGLERKRISKTQRILGYVIYFLIAIFGAFFGGGSGTLILYTMTFCLGFTFIEANATDIVPGLILSITATIVFAVNGILDYRAGIALVAGMLLGGYLGAHTAIKRGENWVRAVFVIVVIAGAAKLLLF